MTLFSLAGLTTFLLLETAIGAHEISTLETVRAALVADAPLPLVITSTSNSIEVSGVTPRAETVLILATRRNLDYVQVMDHRHYSATDEDGDGRVSYRFPESIPADSLAIAIDVGAGTFASLNGPADAFRKSDRANGALRTTGSVLKHLEVASSYVEITWIRPPRGAWTMPLGDGGARDEDGRANGFASANLERMLPIRGQLDPAPAHALPGDLMFIINVRNAEWFVIGERR